MTRRRGLSAETRAFTRWGIIFEDFNNDGLLDLYETTGGVVSGPNRYTEDDPLAEPNLLFEQMDDGRFIAVRPRGGTKELLFASSHGVSAGDIDGDGGIDLVIVNSNSPLTILRNIVPTRGNWISFKVLDRNGIDAIGAELEITLDDGTIQFKQIATSYGYASAHDPSAHVGLGSQKVRTVKIRWPDGSNRTIETPEIGKIHIVQYDELGDE